MAETKAEYASRYYQEHKVEILAKERARYAANPEHRRRVIARTTAYRKAHPEMVRVSTLRRGYGMTPAEYAVLHVRQGGLCAICGNPETATQPRTGVLRSLAVDHDHTSGEIRGLLCSTCNAGLGLLGDDLERLEAAVAYLRAATDQDATAYL